MSNYDVAGAFEDIEMALIKSMRANMKRHIADEFDEGINWSQWQAEMLAGLSQYRAENADVLKGYMGKINAQIDAAIREAYATGESELEIELLKAIKNGYKAPKASKKPGMTGQFFRTNERKLNALIKATTDDMKKAETALLRMNDDIYRQTIFKAQMFYNTGAAGMWKCVDMATKDFLAAGYNCVQYKNGARVDIASYAEMSLRTANKRANLMGQANFREKHGLHLVKVNARGTACPLCLRYLGKVYVDDVYGAGTAEESAKTGYPLLSTAVAGGLFHPNCKDACSTYYPGITREPQDISEKQVQETGRRYRLEQTQRYYERNYRKNMRLANGALDADNAKMYSSRATAYKNKLVDLCNNNIDILRYDRERLSLRGVLSVSSGGRISVPGSSRVIIPTPGKSHTDAYNRIIESIDKIKERATFVYNQVELLTSQISEDEIIKRLAGGDRTKGSCASLGLAYCGNKNGLNVLDFRGGESQNFFSMKWTLEDVAKLLPEGSVKREVARAWATAGNRLLKQVEQGKEYYFVCGRHAAIVRRTEDDTLQYLELQSAYQNGWKNFNGNPRATLENRFGCTGSQGRDVDAFMIDVNAFGGNGEFIDILGYINTLKGEQQKGSGGFAK